MSDRLDEIPPIEGESSLARLMRFCMTNRLMVVLALVFILGWGLMVAPFNWDIRLLPQDPVPVDAIPDTGANQQIVFTEWPGQSPQEVDDQITYPLSAAMLNVSGVKSVRSTSMFGFSSIYVIFGDDVPFSDSRSRLLEKLTSLSEGRDYPEGVKPKLGPEATSLGQVFWYTLEGRDQDGRPAGGWDLEELRTCQDWIIRFHLMAAGGVGEVASIGGFVREYQVDVDPDAMRSYGVTIQQVWRAVRASNRDVGAKTIELNQVEYFVRGVGYIKSVDDIAEAVVTVRDDVPVLIKHIATVTTGPALRRGALDKDGAGAVGGVVVAAFGENPLEVIKNVKARIDQIAPGLPVKTLEDGTVSRVTIVPFYDRTGLIYETLGTLQRALWDEILITVIVVVLMVMHLRTSLLIGSLLPVAVLICFIAMKTFGVDANIVALSGIAIAIGTMVDMGIVICENILRHLDEAGEGESRLEVIYRAAVEVGGAVLTAVMTTVVGFLPVLTMTGERGKLFRPLAYTKTFALIAAVLVALTLIPPAAYILLGKRFSGRRARKLLVVLLAGAGVVAGFAMTWWVAAAMAVFGVYHLTKERLPRRLNASLHILIGLAAVTFVGVLLTRHWEPLGAERGMTRNLIFVAALIGVLLAFFRLFQWAYPTILRWCLNHKLLFLTAPVLLIILGAMIWLGFDTVAAPAAKAGSLVGLSEASLRETDWWGRASRALPGLQNEEMPPLDEGSFLWMPSISSHGSIGAATDYLSMQGRAFRAIPEVDMVVGKVGRVDSPLDPAPLSMVETVINYKSEYITDIDGRRLRYRYDDAAGDFALDAEGRLIPDSHGRPFRQWRPQIKSPKDIWNEIRRAGRFVGLSSAPRLQPIETRRIMLQSGMKSKIGLKILGVNLKDIEAVGIQLERILKQVPSVNADTVIADRQVAKPYLVIDTTSPAARKAMARFNVNANDLLNVVEMAVGGKTVTTTVEGQMRFPVRVRYLRELRNEVETLSRVLVPTATEAQIPMGELVEIRYEAGPQMIKREEGLKVGNVIFDGRDEFGEVEVIEQCRRYVDAKIASGDLVLPAGTSLRYVVAGKSVSEYTRQQKRLYLVMAVALFVIFMILYFQFKSTSTTLLVFCGIFVAWGGGFLLLGLYGTDWFLNFSVFGVNMRDLFAIHPIKMSVAVWVGFLALFGIATDDGVVMATYLGQSFAKRNPDTVAEIRQATLAAGSRRVRPCLMTTATTILALIPVLTSTGRGADVMIPMAIPSFGGMTVEILTMLVVPVLYCWVRELRLPRGRDGDAPTRTPLWLRVYRGARMGPKRLWRGLRRSTQGDAEA